jgi:hypothetical protein
MGGIAIAQTVYILQASQALRRGQGIAREAAGIGFGALSAGCPQCASILLPMVGIAGSLAAFPLGGLEIKLIALAILADTVWEGSRVMAGVCPVTSARLITEQGDEYMIHLNRQTLQSIKPAALIGIGLLAIILLPRLPAQFRVNFATQAASLADAAPATGTDALSLLAQINPPEGYGLTTTYGDIGPQLIAAGAIDQQRFIQLYQSGGSPLSQAEIDILTKGSSERIIIRRENAHFLLNLLWALGLANKNQILDEGPLMQNSGGQITTFASTGGWNLSTRPVAEVYSSTPILVLTPDQQKRVEEAAANTYRPCCNNSTAFADCNHGMAMLGLFELMAAQGASLDEMFNAAKYFNAFWFPQQSINLAAYFEATQGQSFAEVDARTLVSARYSSGRGWNTVYTWLAENGKLEQAPGQNGCGT